MAVSISWRKFSWRAHGVDFRVMTRRGFGAFVFQDQNSGCEASTTSPLDTAGDRHGAGRRSIYGRERVKKCYFSIHRLPGAEPDVVTCSIGIVLEVDTFDFESRNVLPHEGDQAGEGTRVAVGDVAYEDGPSVAQFGNCDRPVSAPGRVHTIGNGSGLVIVKNEHVRVVFCKGASQEGGLPRPGKPNENVQSPSWVCHVSTLAAR